MERLKCKTCGSYSMMPMEVAVEEQAEQQLVAEGDQESRFFTCHVCGDNWLSVKELDDEGACTITFIHQMGMAPVLKRIAHMQTHVVVNEGSVDRWQYYLDDHEIGEADWYAKLTSRRKILKSISCN